MKHEKRFVQRIFKNCMAILRSKRPAFAKQLDWAAAGWVYATFIRNGRSFFLILLVGLWVYRGDKMFFE
jgi:hypothetical protein